MRGPVAWFVSIKAFANGSLLRSRQRQPMKDIFLGPKYCHFAAKSGADPVSRQQVKPTRKRAINICVRRGLLARYMAILKTCDRRTAGKTQGNFLLVAAIYPQ